MAFFSTFSLVLSARIPVLLMAFETVFRETLDDGEPYEKFDTFLAGHMTHGRLSIDGIFCVTDKVAYYVMKALRRMNLRIPEDVQVIGFDGIRQMGDFDYICSTIVQPVEEMARISIGLLFQEPSSARLHTYCLPVTYVCGGSTREPAS